MNCHFPRSAGSKNLLHSRGVFLFFFFFFFLNKKQKTPQRPGYIFLLSVLFIGAISIAVSVSLILLGLAAGESGLSTRQSTQAWEYANTCAERALRSLRSDLTYAGNETFTFSSGSCDVRDVGGSGNTNRTVCTDGKSGQAIRRLEISIAQVYPSVTIATWREVSGFSLCP